MAIKYRESEYVELKVQYVEDIRKEIIAFANTAGGTLYVGIDNNGEVIGLENSDAVIQQIANGLRDAVKPDITLFVNYAVITDADREILEVTVQRGTERPYYLAAKGMRPAGVYVRQGTSSVPASATAIRQMIKDTDGDLFENMRSLNQDLTFEYAANNFAKNALEYGYLQMRSLNMLADEAIYNNLALLLSDQCPHLIKAAKFSGTGQDDFQDRYEFTGSLLKQLDDAYAYLCKYNKTHASFKGLLRIDTKDFPEVALRESLLNAIVHRDYGYIAPTLISIYDDRVEFISIGGLVNGVPLQDLLEGLSVCRNPGLANIFYRLKLIESYGTGLQKIVRAYGKYEMTPVFKATEHMFKVILPNVNYHNTVEPKAEETVAYQVKTNEYEAKVLALFRQKEFILRSDVEELLDVSVSTAARILAKMSSEKLIYVIGNGKNRRYAKHCL